MKTTKKIWISKGALLAGSLAIASTLFSGMPAQAAEKTLDLTDKTNPNTENYPSVTVNLKDVSGGVEVTVNVNQSPAGWTADLRGVWFNLPNPGSANISGGSGGPVTAVTGSGSDSGKFSNSAELTGVKAEFNLGVEIGSQGLKGGSDDYQTTTFTIAGVSVNDFSSDIIGTRLMSVGPDENRDYSSKTGSAVIPSNYDEVANFGNDIAISEVAPEPLTIAGTLLGGGAVAALRKRKGNKKAS